MLFTTLLRYSSDQDYFSAYPLDAGEIPDARLLHTAALGRLVGRLPGRIRVVDFDQASYRAYLADQGLPDAQTSRAAWAGVAAARTALS